MICTLDAQSMYAYCHPFLLHGDGLQAMKTSLALPKTNRFAQQKNNKSIIGAAAMLGPLPDQAGPVQVTTQSLALHYATKPTAESHTRQ